MAKVFLTCCTPFKHLLSSDELAAGLFSPLVIDLQHLQKSLEEKPPSLQWCTEAVVFIKNIHSHLLIYLERSKVPVCWEGVNVLDEYMRVSLDVLDFCNLLKSNISGLERHRMKVEFMINNLKDAMFSTKSKIEVGGHWEETSNKPSDVEKWREMNLTLSKEGVSKVKLKTRNISIHVIQAIGSTMSLISVLIFCSILHPIPLEIVEGFDTPLTNLNPFSRSIKNLVASFTGRIRNVQRTGRPILYENEMIEDAFATYQEQVLSAKEGVQKGSHSETLNMLKKRPKVIKEALDMFESVVNELFDDVMKGRKQMIDLITANNQNY